MKWIIILTLFVAPIVPSQTVIPSVELVRVVDGDTIVIRPPGRDEEYSVRLWGVDAPEIDQPYGQEAKEYLDSLLYDRAFFLSVQDVDRWERLVSIVVLYEPRETVQRYLLHEGWAWHYVDFAPDQTDYTQLQQRAQANKKGLWQQRNPTPPWEFRND